MRYWTLTAIAILVPFVSVRGEPLLAGKWLVDLGRDYPLSPQASLTDADARITLQFMQAATRVDPKLAEGYLWQFDMYRVLGQEQQSQEALSKYVGLQPDDVAAHLAWIALTVDGYQTAEERTAFLEKYTERRNLPAEVISDVHYRLADLYRNRNDKDRSKTHARKALQHNPLNVSARMMLAALEDDSLSDAEQVELLLTQISLNPADVGKVWQLADLLLSLNMPQEADQWYGHISRIQNKLSSDQPSPALLIARGLAMYDSHQLSRAEAYVKMAIGMDAGFIAAHILNSRIAAKQGNTTAARNHIFIVTNIYKSTISRGQETLDPAIIAEMAWFFAHYDPQPTEAAKLARSALAAWPNSIVAQRALGSALRQLNKTDEAQNILTNSAESDIWSAVELAQVLRAAGQNDRASAQLRSVASKPMSSEQREIVQQLLSEWKIKAPTSQPAANEIKTMLQAFPSAILDYPLNPEKYLSAALKLSDTTLAPGEPWRCTLHMKNKGPFAITIGPGMMIAPEVTCLITTQGDLKRSSGPIINIQLNRSTMLMPGDSLVINQTIDLGRIRGSMIGTPQMTHDVEITAILSPVVMMSKDGKQTCIPNLGGQAIGPVRFQRRAFMPTTDSLRSLINQSRSNQVSERIDATELLAMLLAENQHLKSRRLRYPAKMINVNAVQEALLGRINDRDWQVRVRLAECMRWFVLDKNATNTATKLLQDQHWLVRGLALRMFADQYGKKFINVLQRYAKDDPDQWVRQFADALLARIGTTTQPADK